MKTHLITTFITTAFLSSLSLGATFSNVEVQCKGSGLTAIVLKTQGELRLAVIEDGSLALSEIARKRTIETGPIVYRTEYSTGPVLQGGISLRVTTKHKNVPKVAGTAFLTAILDGHAVNVQMKCSKY